MPRVITILPDGSLHTIYAGDDVQAARHLEWLLEARDQPVLTLRDDGSYSAGTAWPDDRQPYDAASMETAKEIARWIGYLVGHQIGSMHSHRARVEYLYKLGDGFLLGGRAGDAPSPLDERGLMTFARIIYARSGAK